MKTYVKTWLSGLASTVISGVATSFLSAIGVTAADLIPGMEIAALDARQLAVIAAMGGLVGLANYLKASPIPKPEVLGVLLLAGLLTGGCVTAPDGTRSVDVQAVADGVEIAAFFGTSIAVQEKPATGPVFALAAAELRTLAADEDIQWLDVVAIVQRLPVSELESAEAGLYIASGTLILQRFGDRLVNLNDIQKVKPVVEALANGIELGLKQSANAPPPQ